MNLLQKENKLMTWKNENSKKAFLLGKNVMPGGVNSPVRAWKTMNMEPVILKKAFGSKVVDVDENEYIDYICSYGPLILGHSHPAVVKAIQDAAANGTTFGSTSLGEIEFCKEIVDAFPSIEKVRLVNSGTEATMSAIRLARAYTRRDLILKFEGCYHGHADSFLMKAGSGLLTDRIPSSPGVPHEVAQLTLNCPFNDFARVEEAFQEFGTVKSAVIVNDKKTGVSRGFGFIEMPNDDEAQKAIDELNGATVQGRAIVVNKSEPKPEGERRSFKT